MHEIDEGPFPPPFACSLAGAEELLQNPGTIVGLTEDFAANRRFCARPEDGETELDKVYATNQDAFNAQSEAACLALAQIVIECQADRSQSLCQSLRERLQALRDGLASLPYLTSESSVEDVFSTRLNNSPAELLMSCFALYRRLLATHSRTEACADFGALRYGKESTGRLATPLDAPRYQPSVERCSAGAAFEGYVELSLALERESMENDPFGIDYPEDEIIERLAKLEEIYRDKPDSFELIRRLDNTSISFGKVDNSIYLENFRITDEHYELVYGEIDSLLLGLLDDILPDPAAFLDSVFRLQYWFIHIMPFWRGSAAIMNWVRYVMTAYYNHRAQEDDRAPLPTVPSRAGFFPDLEALLCCPTPDDFVEKSMTEIYCADYTAYRDN